jgi:hypothetical protein
VVGPNSLTPTAFRFRLEVLGLTVRRFAGMTGEDYETARAWGSQLPDGGVQDFPPWVELLITAWEHEGKSQRTLGADPIRAFRERLQGEPMRALSVEPVPVYLQFRHRSPPHWAHGAPMMFPGGPLRFQQPGWEQ